MSDFEDLLKKYRDQVNENLKEVLPSEGSRLTEAMRYSVLNGGKRLRPILVYLSSNLGQCRKQDIDLSACAVELIHCYSLVHDDLPSMDNDDLRRGNPTCHVKFDEATAILAGDALQPLAFELICKINVKENIKIILLSKLASACGHLGMVGGQVKDINMDHEATIDDLDLMHFQKTGRLIQASLEIGGHLSNLDKEIIEMLSNYGEKIGLAFQIQDDIIDIESPSLISGKNQGSDLDQNKITYPSLVSLEEAKAKAYHLAEEAKEILVPLSKKADNLRFLADYIVSRNS
mgnify:CR=1 FL=1|tara:strand:- start:2281 stop:3150 length:870 start_codon:yes stop_codon:yes gene_type:complete